MSITLLNYLNGNGTGVFKRFIDSFDDSPSIAWYPSAGRDLRDIMYLSPEYSKMVDMQRPTGTAKGLKHPDLFIHTDYFPWKTSRFLDSRLVHKDAYTSIVIEEIEQLPQQQLKLDESFVHFPEPTKTYGHVVFMWLKIESHLLGIIRKPLLYVFSENTTFFRDVLRVNNARISHVVKIRYGGGCGGGGTAAGAWLHDVLEDLGCEFFIHDNHYYNQSGDEYAREFLDMDKPSTTEPQLTTFYELPSECWSCHGDITWNYVHA